MGWNTSDASKRIGSSSNDQSRTSPLFTQSFQDRIVILHNTLHELRDYTQAVQDPQASIELIIPFWYALKNYCAMLQSSDQPEFIQKFGENLWKHLEMRFHRFYFESSTQQNSQSNLETEYHEEGDLNDLFPVQAQCRETEVEINMMPTESESYEWKEQYVIAAMISPSSRRVLRDSEDDEKFKRMFRGSVSIKRVSPASTPVATPLSLPLTPATRSVNTLLQNAHNRTTATLEVRSGFENELDRYLGEIISDESRPALQFVCSKMPSYVHIHVIFDENFYFFSKRLRIALLEED